MATGSFNTSEIIMNNITIIKTNKICSKCRLEKPIEDFRKSKSSKDNHMNFCKLCHSNNSKQQYEKNKELRLAQIEYWSENNPHKVDKYNTKYRAKKKKENRKLKRELRNRPELLNEEVVEKIDSGETPTF